MFRHSSMYRHWVVICSGPGVVEKHRDAYSQAFQHRPRGAKERSQ